MIKKILANVLLVIVVVICLCAILVMSVRKYRLITNHVGDAGIEEEVYINTNGQQHYCLIRGEDTTNPVIIWIHGGPASPDSMLCYYISESLKENYTVIAYNQRGCGRTYYANADVDPKNEEASFENLQKDLDGIVNYAKNRFNQEKVIIVGHSFGTMVGSQYALDHPEKVDCYIGVGQMGGEGSSEYIFEDGIEKAKEAGDDWESIEAKYQEYLENPDVENLLALRKMEAKYHTVENSSNYIMDAFLSPYMNLEDVKWFLNQLSLDKFVGLNPILFQYIEEHNVYEYGLDFEVPVGIIEGSDDWITPAKCAQEYLDDLNAPKKEMMIVDGWGHSLPQENPALFAKTLEEMIDALHN